MCHRSCKPIVSAESALVDDVSERARSKRCETTRGVEWFDDLIISHTESTAHLLTSNMKLALATALAAYAVKLAAAESIYDIAAGNEDFSTLGEWALAE